MKKICKIIPFSKELAEKIQAGEVEGKIVCNGCEVVILDYNSKRCSGYPIRIVYLDKDEVDYTIKDCLHIEVPDIERQFKPFDKVLVRNPNNKDDKWTCDIFSHMDGDCYVLLSGYANYKVIPYEGNEHLVGTTDEPRC